MKRLFDVAHSRFLIELSHHQRFSRVPMGPCYFASFDAMLEIIVAMYC